MKRQQADGNNINREEIAHLAYVSWEKDGCPHGRDVEYWLEIESQLKATRHLLTRECGLATAERRRPTSPRPKDMSLVR